MHERQPAVPRDEAKSLVMRSHLNHVPLDHSSVTNLARRSNAGVVASAKTKGRCGAWGTSSSATVERKLSRTAPFHPSPRLTSHVPQAWSLAVREMRDGSIASRIGVSLICDSTACEMGHVGAPEQQAGEIICRIGLRPPQSNTSTPLELPLGLPSSQRAFPWAKAARTRSGVAGHVVV